METDLNFFHSQSIKMIKITFITFSLRNDANTDDTFTRNVQWVLRTLPSNLTSHVSVPVGSVSVTHQWKSREFDFCMELEDLALILIVFIVFKVFWIDKWYYKPVVLVNADSIGHVTSQYFAQVEYFVYCLILFFLFFWWAVWCHIYICFLREICCLQMCD